MDDFPIEVFEDVKRTDFFKHNKKHVTEDFVTENFKELGWKVYRPFNDTGIDLIATKFICPNNHTQLSLSLEGVCPICNSPAIEIVRFIQVKTREIKGDEASQFFGYTLRSKDFRTDPRHVFLLYSDYSKDFIIIPMFEYLSFFDSTGLGLSHFGAPSFRVGNHKQNSLRKTGSNWTWSKHSLNSFVNIEGLKLISSPKYELSFEDYCKRITELKLKLFYTYSKGRECSAEIEELINFSINKFASNSSKIIEMRKATNHRLSEELANNLKTSITNGYFIKFKGVKFDG